jgi:hypothetical protein
MVYYPEGTTQNLEPKICEVARRFSSVSIGRTIESWILGDGNRKCTYNFCMEVL